jgi:nucleoside-diphosphate-sugar epimerase
VHLADLARAVVHVALHPDDRAVRGRAFNVADEAPLPLAEHLAAALTSLGYEPGRIIPSWPRVTSSLLWLFRNVPDRTLLAALNRRLASGWDRLRARTGVSALLTPRIDREALHWMSTDHYYDTGRLRALGWRAIHPVATAAFPETVRAMVAGQFLPGSGGKTVTAW